MAFFPMTNSDENITEPNQLAIDQIQEVMVQKAVELFHVCDKEKKGYITRTDMQRLRVELQVSHDQLEVVFDSLDTDRKGYITLQGFTDGFGSFLGLPLQSGSQTDVEAPDLYECQDETSDAAIEDKMFHDMMWQIRAASVFKDEDVVKAMWLKLHREELEMAKAFEEFIADLAEDIRKSAVDFQSLEAALKSKRNEHEEEVRKLYEEMELQIKQEREKILTEEKAKERHMRGELETQLKEKEKQLQDVLTRHQELEQKMSSLNKVDTVTKHENEQLQKEKNKLETLLSLSQDSLEASRTYIQHIQLKQTDKKREKARSCDDILDLGGSKDNYLATFDHELQLEKSRSARGRRVAQVLSEGIALERESLIKQLNLLRDISKRLRDDRDEAEATDARLRKSKEGSHSIPTQVQERSFVSKMQYNPPTFSVAGKSQQSTSQSK